MVPILVDKLVSFISLKATLFLSICIFSLVFNIQYSYIFIIH